MNTRIKEVREALQNDKGKKYTQTQFAEALHVTRDMIASFESGKVTPTPLFINSLCKTFNVNENWLRTGDGEMFQPKDFDEEVTDIVWSIVDKKSLSEEERNQYIELIKIISSTGAEDIDLLLRVAKRFNKNNPL